MASLKGIFEPKPQHKKNFLLENIKNVKIKSNLNSKRDGNSMSSLQREKGSLTSAVPLSKACFEAQKSACKKPQTMSSSNQSQNFDEKHSCCGMSASEISSHRKHAKIRSKTMHYIHQENVPFEWTEMCPSLVSHNICHQGVQTEECENKDENYVNRLSKECSKGPNVNTYITEKQLPNESELLYQQPSALTVPMSQVYDKVAAGEHGLSAVKGTSPRCGGDNEYEKVWLGNSAVTDFTSAPKMQGGESSRKVDGDSSKHDYSKLVSDFESAKISSRGTSSLRQQLSGTLVPPPSYQKGVVPRYLSQRKNELLMAAAQLKAVDPNCPPGHVAMPENERKETLDLIIKNYNDLVRELNKMPVRTDTLKMKQRKIELEKQLDKLEEGIRVFSRPKVYIKLNA